MKKGIALLLAALVLLFTGTAAFAESGSGLQKGDTVYLGRWQDAPIRWTVLDPDATNAGGNGLFLLCEQALTNQGVIYSWTKAVWQGSEGQTWCSALLEQSFSAAEQAAVPAVSKSEEGLQQYGLSWGPVELENEKVFFLSVRELGDYIGPNDGDPGLSATYVGNGKPTYYWLRTPHASHPDYAGLVLEGNEVHDFLVYGSWAGRPATNLGGEGLLYLAAADRVIAPCEPGPMPASANGEWKATAADPALTLTVEDARYADGQLSVQYAGAPAGAWISVLVRDAEGKNVSYGCLAKTEGGTGTVSFSPALPEGGCAYLFAELDNGPMNTNAASALCPLSWVEEPEPTPTPEAEPETAEEPEEGGGTIALAEPEESATPAAPAEGGGLISFLRETWMFAVPFALLSAAAVILAIAKAVDRHRRRDDDDDDREE